MFGTKCFAHHPANKGILRDFSEKQAHEIVQPGSELVGIKIRIVQSSCRFAETIKR